MGESKSSESPFSKALRIFLIEINGLSESLPIIMKSLVESRHKSEQQINQFFEEHGEIVEKTEEDENGQDEDGVVRRQYPSQRGLGSGPTEERRISKTTSKR